MDDLTSIIGSLSEDDIGKLKGLANDLFGNNSEPEPQENRNKETEFSLDPNVLSRVAKIMSTLNRANENDDRTQFLSSLKPLLSEKRQKKADEAMKMMHLFDVLPLLKESGIF